MLNQVEILTIPRLVVLALGSTVGLVLWLLVRLGTFVDVETRLAPQGTLNLIYKEHLGAYHTTVRSIIEVEEWFATNRVDCSESFAEYLDDVALVSEDRLRSRGGCIVQPHDQDKIPAQLPPSFVRETRPERLVALAEFRGSPSIAPYKVYPRIEELIRAEGMTKDGPILEIYRIGEGRTTYHQPVLKR